VVVIVVLAKVVISAEGEGEENNQVRQQVGE
jgi:hypothetical protein